MCSVSHTAGAVAATPALYFAVELEVDAALGLVTTPIAKPPIAPAKIPIKARSRVLSTNVVFPRLDINPPRFGGSGVILNDAVFQAE
ncbi:MAG: hypothetical protein ACLQLC_20075 [Candidatus Sulfotelmatobacter sp.]